MPPVRTGHPAVTGGQWQPGSGWLPVVSGGQWRAVSGGQRRSADDKPHPPR